MKLISHRGNFFKKNIEAENTVKQINFCLNLGVDVEIDVWYYDNNWWLGHDKPEYTIDEKFLCNPNLWCHAKNYLALFRMCKNLDIHYFWHDTDAYTITSHGYLWAYPGSVLNNKTICVLPEKATYTSDQLSNCAGICSDNIQKYL